VSDDIPHDKKFVVVSWADTPYPAPDGPIGAGGSHLGWFSTEQQAKEHADMHSRVSPSSKYFVGRLVAVGEP
jgi:hypothetical protein